MLQLSIIHEVSTTQIQQKTRQLSHASSALLTVSGCHKLSPCLIALTCIRTQTHTHTHKHTNKQTNKHRHRHTHTHCGCTCQCAFRSPGPGSPTEESGGSGCPRRVETRELPPATTGPSETSSGVRKKKEERVNFQQYCTAVI